MRVVFLCVWALGLSMFSASGKEEKKSEEGVNVESFNQRGIMIPR